MKVQGNTPRREKCKHPGSSNVQCQYQQQAQLQPCTKQEDTKVIWRFYDPADMGVETDEQQLSTRAPSVHFNCVVLPQTEPQETQAFKIDEVSLVNISIESSSLTWTVSMPVWQQELL